MAMCVVSSYCTWYTSYCLFFFFFFFFNDTATTEIYTLSLQTLFRSGILGLLTSLFVIGGVLGLIAIVLGVIGLDRKSGSAGMPGPISNAAFCLKKSRWRRWHAGSPRTSRTTRHENRTPPTTI